jgi:hypothetical protein
MEITEDYIEANSMGFSKTYAGFFEGIDSAKSESSFSVRYNSPGHEMKIGVGRTQQHAPLLPMVEA